MLSYPNEAIKKKKIWVQEKIKTQKVKSTKLLEKKDF